MQEKYTSDPSICQLKLVVKVEYYNNNNNNNTKFT